MPSTCTPPLKKLLVINPNTSVSMTKGLEDLIRDLGPSSTFEIFTHTATSGLESIDDENDAHLSSQIVLEEIEPTLADYDAFLVACYSVHPLVTRIRERIDPAVHVTGIFEASIATALALLPQRWGRRLMRGNLDGYETFGIVSTGSSWRGALTKGVVEFLGEVDERGCSRFKAVETTGLSAGELHTADQAVVRDRMKEATKRLVKDKDCSVICLGCAGMAGMDEIIREAIVEELGETEAEFIRIVDGLRAGIGYLEGVVRALPDRRAIRKEIKPERTMLEVPKKGVSAVSSKSAG